ncbi:unnamed protein product [Vicia faba]|uniref:Uncharacterized protein n=1 Tax=Vicia faba TaxID=3906 RepID=A0AAV1B8H2_VICFA|nr:unnamed protein product [Vicia faba]
MEKKDKKSKTVWEENLRKQLEKKRARRNKSKYSSDDDDDSDNTVQEATEEAEDFFMGEPDITKKKKKKKAESKNDKDQKLQDLDGVSKEELELLLADDKGTDTVHMRIHVLHLFTHLTLLLIPPDPQFKRSAVYVRQLAQKQQKGHMELPAEKEHTKLPKETKLPSGREKRRQ